MFSNTFRTQCLETFLIPLDSTNEIDERTKKLELSFSTEFGRVVLPTIFTSREQFESLAKIISFRDALSFQLKKYTQKGGTNHPVSSDFCRCSDFRNIKFKIFVIREDTKNLK